MSESSHTSPDDRKSILKLAEFRVYVDLYKYFLRMCLSVNVFFLGVVGGLLTFIFRPATSEPGKTLSDKPFIDTLLPPVKLIFLVTPFILSCVLMLSFAVGALYWWLSTRAINKKIKAQDVEMKLVTRPFFHLLTWLLVAAMSIFMFVAILLGRIMAHYGVLFCDGCLLPRSRLPAIAIVALVVVFMSPIVIRYGTKPTKKLWNNVRPRAEKVIRYAKGEDVKLTLLFACIFIASTTLLLGNVSGVFHLTSETPSWVDVITALTAIVSAISTIAPWIKKLLDGGKNGGGEGKKPDPPNSENGK